MQNLPLSQLTETQTAQVAYLFADELFGTDAGAFVYEVNQAGEVKGRTAISKERTATSLRAKRGAAVSIRMIQEAHITERMVSQISASMDALAVSVAMKLQERSTLFEEVIK